MIPCIIAVLFITGAICIPLFILVAPIIVALVVFAAKATMVAIPVGALLILYLAAQKAKAEQLAREAARIAEAERQRLRRQRELEAARLRAERQAERQAEAARRAAGPRNPIEYPPGAAGWAMRFIYTIATASATSSGGWSGDDDYTPPRLYNAPYTPPRVVAPPSATPAATKAADPAAGGDCAVCCDRAADTLLMPCKHLVVCGVSCLSRTSSVVSLLSA